jgi:Rieske Fe-S protein
MTGTKGKILWVILLTGFLSVTCDKEENIIPYVPVSFSVNLNVVNDLNVPGNSVYFAGPGFGGVIIYCELPGSYYAYDAACTHEISSACKVKNDGVLGTCACCGSQFILMGGGYPSKGPATFPLQSYHVSVMSNILRIYN